MILPKELFDKIEYFEHTMEHPSGHTVYDVFTIHFKQWWRKKRVIKIHRVIYNYDCDTGMLRHRVTPSAADLYNQLNDWSTETFEEKWNSVQKKYESHELHDNVVVLKPKPKDIDDEH